MCVSSVHKGYHMCLTDEIFNLNQNTVDLAETIVQSIALNETGSETDYRLLYAKQRALDP